jgi:hypothetical protein
VVSAKPEAALESAPQQPVAVGQSSESSGSGESAGN